MVPTDPRRHPHHHPTGTAATTCTRSPSRSAQRHQRRPSAQRARPRHRRHRPDRLVVRPRGRVPRPPGGGRRCPCPTARSSRDGRGVRPGPRWTGPPAAGCGSAAASGRSPRPAWRLMMVVRRPVQTGEDVCQRPHQPGHRPKWQRVEPEAVVPELIDAECPKCFRPSLSEQAATVIAGRVDDRCPGRSACRRCGCRTRLCGHSATASEASAARVSMSTRQEWICCMPRFSFSARSRPDRWM